MNLKICFCILLFPLNSFCQQITIDASRILNTIPKQLYGSCIEDVNHEIYGGLYGQRLYGESFEEPAGSTGVSAAWDAGKNGTFSLDIGFNGKQSQVIQNKGSIYNSGLNRWGIAVRKGQRFDGRVYLRQEQFNGQITVALQSADGQHTYASQQINKVGKEWARYDFSLVTNTTDPTAHFALSVTSPGKVWIDQAVLLSGQFKGLPLRADIAVKMQEEGLNFLRYGGTMVNAPEYRWKKMIGDRDKRPPYRGHWYPYSSNSFGIEDFLQFCEAARFEAAFAINIEESAEDAADLVEYLKGDFSTSWGKKRAENGHPQPYKVKYIEIGNEEVIFHGDVTAEYDHYIERFNALYKAMHAKDTSIKLINSAWWRPESPNMERVFKALDGKAAYWDLHTDADNARAGTTVDKNLTNMQSLFKQWNPATTMKCTIFEENGGLHSLQRALGHATTLNAVRRHGDFVLTSCAANALQPMGQNDNGWDQGQIFFTPSEVWGMPPFYAQQMAAAYHEPLRVMSTTEGDLDVTATRSEDGKSLVLHVVNAGEAAQSCNLVIEGFENRTPDVSVSELAGRISAKTLKLEGKQISYTFPAASYTILKFTK